MAIRKFSTASIKSGVKSSKFWDQTTVIINPAYESIATVSVGTATSTVSFTSIPSTFEHLELRWRMRCSSTGPVTFQIRFNGDSNSNYYHNHLYASSSTTGFNQGSGTQISVWDNPGSNATAKHFSAGVMNIFEYADTNKRKKTQAFNGFRASGAGYAFNNSGMWTSTNAINEITIIVEASKLHDVGTHFALYGIKTS